MTSQTFAVESPRMRPRSAFAATESCAGFATATLPVDACAVEVGAPADEPLDGFAAASPREHAIPTASVAAVSPIEAAGRKRLDAIVILESTRAPERRQSM